MRIIITGASGTVGSALADVAAGHGADVIPWDRDRVPVDDYHRMEDFVRETGAAALVHLAIASQPSGRNNESWLVNYEWSSELAWITRQLGVRFVFTSTALVFSDHAPGPFTVDSVPDASDGYGYEKRMAETRVLEQNPATIVLRLGWQIGERPGSNNMIDYLAMHAERDGLVKASRRWLPACSFLPDTAECLWRLATVDPAPAGGIYMADSNSQWSFFDIATALSARHGRQWRIEPVDDFEFDQRMRDERVSMPGLQDRLPDLP